MSAEHIQVAIRLRPLNHLEIASGDRRIWAISKGTVLIRPESHHTLATEKRVSTGCYPSFQFDHCFSWDDDTAKVYDAVVKKMVVSTLEGYNATVFAYGQTGSGKTYTMLGKSEEEDADRRRNHRRDSSELTPEIRKTRKSLRQRSITPRFDPSLSIGKKLLPQGTSKGIMIMAFEDIFQAIHEARQTHYFLTCSYMEIYNEHIYDLLREDKDSKEALSVSETPEKDFIVKGLSAHSIQNIDDLLRKLEAGEAMRHYAETQMNHHSSRSHTIFRLNVKSLQVLQQECEEERSDVLENVTTESTLNFVDLAGSERLSTQCPDPSSKSDQDKTVAEGKHINTSLFYLCQVITKLSEIKLGVVRADAHVPFRNAAITKILRASLGGNARTCVLCTATPALSQFEQTLSTFRFGASARTITNEVQRNVRHASSAQLLLAYEQDASDLRRELESSQVRCRQLSAEAAEARNSLEARARKLTQMMFERGKIEGGRYDARWCASAGELISDEKLMKNCEEMPINSLKTDVDGTFAAIRAAAVSTAVNREQQEIAILQASLGDEETMRKTLQERIESLHIATEYKKEKCGKRLEELTEMKRKVRNAQVKADLYENSLGLSHVSEEELFGLEAELLLSIDRVSEIRAKKRTDHLISLLKHRLREFISDEEVEVAAVESEGWAVNPKLLSFPDLSAIDDSFPNDTMDSVHQFF